MQLLVDLTLQQVQRWPRFHCWDYASLYLISSSFTKVRMSHGTCSLTMHAEMLNRTTEEEGKTMTVPQQRVYQSAARGPLFFRHGGELPPVRRRLFEISSGVR